MSVRRIGGFSFGSVVLLTLLLFQTACYSSPADPVVPTLPPSSDETEADEQSTQAPPTPSQVVNGEPVCALIAKSKGVAAVSKELVARYDYEQSLDLANRYLATNAFFQPLELRAGPPATYQGPQLKDSFGHLYYGFSLNSMDGETRSIEGGRLWLNAETGEPYLIDVLYADSEDIGGLHRIDIPKSQRLPLAQALQRAIDMTLAMGIDLAEPAFDLVGTDDEFLYTYRFLWRATIQDVAVNDVQVRVHHDGRFKQFIYKARPLKVPLEPSISLPQIRELAKSYLLECEPHLQLAREDIKFEKAELILSPNPRNIHWADRALVWVQTFRLTNQEKARELNICVIVVYLNAHTGEVVFFGWDREGGGYAYRPCHTVPRPLPTGTPRR